MKINYILASLALVTGITASFTNHSSRNNLYPAWKFEKGKIDGNRIRYVSASHLADLLYQKEQGLRILDARSVEDYEKYHISSAQVFNNGQSSGAKDDLIVLYGSGGNVEIPGIAKQLPGRVYVLKGGIEEWYRLVLFPDFSELQIRNRQTLERILDRSLYFGGSPRNSQLLNITERTNRFREGC